MSKRTIPKYQSTDTVTTVEDPKTATGCCSGSSPCCDTVSKSNLGSTFGEKASQVPVIPQVSTVLSFKDRLGTWKTRWGWGRMRYTVRPGLYAVGNPTAESHVFVTANYKLSFDRLRSNLTGRDGWIMVLDTKGINVWCAAGKGTFGTDEIINRIEAVKLSEVVSHKKLILPQLGAPGVKAHEVKERTGFGIVYGPVRAEDLPEFLDARLKATPEMRRVCFNLADRLVLIPVEITGSLKWLIQAAALLFVLSSLGPGGSSWERIIAGGIQSIILLLGAYLAGAVITPLLLPWLPGRAFSAKGATAGLMIIILAAGFLRANPGQFYGWVNAGGMALIILAVSSFMAMNFTGASTYTSLSGVVKEMKVAVPLQIAGAVVGLGLWITARFV